MAVRIQKEYEALIKNPIENVIFEMNESNMHEWTFVIFGPIDSVYKDGVYNGKLIIPKEYPHRPPEVKFITKLFHPNVYDNGKLCMSILHEGKDPTGYEKEEERWRPLNNIRTIFISIISLLYDPNPDSPANIDAGVMWRNNKDAYIQKVKDDMK
jgi:ubiquitin-conjugating enzyme E2 G1